MNHHDLTNELSKPGFPILLFLKCTVKDSVLVIQTSSHKAVKSTSQHFHILIIKVCEFIYASFV